MAHLLDQDIEVFLYVKTLSVPSMSLAFYHSCEFCLYPMKTLSIIQHLFVCVTELYTNGYVVHLLTLVPVPSATQYRLTGPWTALLTVSSKLLEMSGQNDQTPLNAQLCHMPSLPPQRNPS